MARMQSAGSCLLGEKIDWVDGEKCFDKAQEVFEIKKLFEKIFNFENFKKSFADFSNSSVPFYVA